MINDTTKDNLIHILKETSTVELDKFVNRANLFEIIGNFCLEGQRMMDEDPDE